MDFGAALLALVTGVFIKIAVMAIGSVLLVKLYRASYGDAPKRLWLLLPKENLPEVRLVWWSLLCFFVAEWVCGIEVYILFRSNPWLSGIHAAASALGMGLFTLGVYLYLDKKLFRYGQKACLANRICRGCTIEEPVGCKYRATLMLTATFVGLAALPAFFVPTDPMHADPTRWVLPFASWNAFYDQTYVPWIRSLFPDYEPSSIAYTLTGSMMWIEFRLQPAIALVLAAVAVGLGRASRERTAAKVLVFAIGFLCYPYFEMVLYRVTGDVYIGSLGHELAEFWFLVALAEFLRRTFPPDVPAGESAPAEPTAA